MRRGEVWTVADANRQWRVVVLSADGYNTRGQAYCAPIVRRTAGGETSPFAVALTDPDPLSGVAVVDIIQRIPADAGSERVGMLAGATFARVEAAFRDLFDL